MLLDKQIDYFLENGYIILPKLFDAQEVRVLLDKANALKTLAKELAQTIPDSEVHKIAHRGSMFVIQNLDEQIKIHRIVWAGSTEPELLNISKQNKLLFPVSELLESPRANHIINSLHLKLPNDEIEFTIHQDIHHRQNYDHNWTNANGDRSYVACITAIDPMLEDNGPIMMLSGSHKQGEILRDKLQEQFDLNYATPLLLEPGDTACMHQYLVHWSLPNNSSNSRLTLINGFSYPGANHGVYPGEGSGELIDLLTPVDYL